MPFHGPGRLFLWANLGYFDRKRFVLLSALVLATAAFAGSFPDISLKSLKKAIADKDVAILDVNGAETYKRGHIPGAIDFISDRAILPRSFLVPRMLSLLRIV